MSTITYDNLENQFRELGPYQEELSRRLAGVRRQVKTRLFVHGVAMVLVTALGLAAATLALDWLFRLQLSVRILLGLVCLGVIGYVAYKRLLKPLSVKMDELDLAVALDRRCAGVGERIAGVLQLPSLIAGTAQASPSLVRAAVLDSASDLHHADFSTAFDQKDWWRSLGSIAGVILAAIAFSGIVPSVASLWAKRWLMGSNERWPQQTYLSLIGLGDKNYLIVPRNEGLTLQVQSNPQFEQTDEGWRLDGRGEPLLLTSEQPPESEIPSGVSMRYKDADGAEKRGAFASLEDGRFRLDLPIITDDLNCTIYGGDDWMGPFEIRPVDRPVLKSMKIISTAPGRTMPREQDALSADAQLTFLPKTKLSLQFTGNVPLSRVQLDQVGAAGAGPEIVRDDDSSFHANWEINDAQSFELRVWDAENELESKTYYLSLGRLDDQPPKISLRSIGIGRRITPQARLPLVIQLRDDFGLSSAEVRLEQITVVAEKSETKEHVTPLEFPTVEAEEGSSTNPPAENTPHTELELQKEIPLTDLALIPGTTVRAQVAAEDNCFEGKQQGQSRWLSFQVVTPDELFYEILTKQRAERQKFVAAHETAKKQLDELSTIVSVEQTDDVLRKHQLVARQTWQAMTRLDATLQEMTYNELASPQARDLLLQKVIDPLKQLHNEAMASQRVSLDDLTAKLQQQADFATEKEEAVKNQQEIVNEMQKIRDQMSQWESFVDVLNQLRAVINAQDSVRSATEEERETRTGDLFDK